jgi:hypothetical protein
MELGFTNIRETILHEIGTIEDLHKYRERESNTGIKGRYNKENESQSMLCL